MSTNIMTNILIGLFMLALGYMVNDIMNKDTQKDIYQTVNNIDKTMSLIQQDLMYTKKELYTVKELALKNQETLIKR